MDRRNKFKHIFSLIIVIIGILSLLGGTSYAILKGSTTAENEQVIKAGSVELKLTENFENIDKKITVMSNVDGLLQEDVYDFNLKNIGSEPAEFKIKLANEVPSDYTGKVLEEKYFKVGLEINGEEYGPISLSEANNIIDNDIIYEREMISYKMRIWLDKEKQEELSDMEDYKAFLKLKVEATQRPEEMDHEKPTVFNYTGDVQEYKVTRDGYYYIETAGAEGGSATYSYNYEGGLGGYSSGYVELEAGDKLYFYVGGMGSSHKGTTTDTPTANGNGYNGGSTGNFYASNSNTGGGGGATDVRLVKDQSKEKYRYVRSYINGSDVNEGNHWVEIQVYDTKGTLISSGKPVTHNGTSMTYAGTATSAAALTDGNTTSANYVEVKGVTNAYVEIDLGEEYNISKINVWHYYTDGRTYNGNKVVLLDSRKDKTLTLFDSGVDGTYAETSNGKTIYNNDKESLKSRIMVAGGGGGATAHVNAPSYSGAGGDGGTLNGQVAQYYNTTCYSYGGAATQISSGYTTACSSSYSTLASGAFGSGGTERHAGGGGGYYGGGTGYHTSAGGGSSYISGYAGANSVSDADAITHTNQTIHYSGKYFVGGKMLAGTNSGNGYAKIAYVNSKPKRKNNNLNGVRYIKNCVNGDSSNNLNSWTEIQAIKDGVNVAKGKTGSIYDASGNAVASLGTAFAYSYVTDGIIDNVGGSIGYAAGSTRTGHQCFIVDLEEEYDLDEVATWHYTNDMRTYFDDIVYVSSDNSTWTELIDETMYGHSNGKRVNAYTDTYNGYVQDGLVLWYDGHANTGTTRNHSTTTWKDLSGSGYNGTLTGCSWSRDYLYFDGTDDTVVSNVAASTLLPAGSDRTLSITLKVNSVPYTNTTYGNTGVFLGAAYYNGMGISWDRTSSANSFSTYGFTRTSVGYASDLGKYSYPTKVLQLTYVNKPSEGVIKSYVNGKPFSSNLSDAGSYNYASTMGNVGINKAQIYGGNHTTGYANMFAYGAQIYDRALSKEEVTHNYLVDKQRFGLE